MTDPVILAEGLAFPEGPVVAGDGAVWVSELKAGRLARIDIAGRIDRFETGGSPNGLAFAADGRLWFCDQERGEVRRFDPVTGVTETVAASEGGRPLAAPNDLTFARDGSLVFSCPGDSRREATGYLCRLDPDGAVSRIAEGLLFPNGVCLSPAGDRLFVAETYGCRVLSGAWNPGDRVSLDPLFDTPGPIGADGIAVLGTGCVATCVHGAGIVRIHERATETTRDVAVPDARPAGCAIHPFARWPLIVTGTERGVVMGVPV